jgi:hypothetical protein
MPGRKEQEHHEPQSIGAESPRNQKARRQYPLRRPDHDPVYGGGDDGPVFDRPVVSSCKAAGGPVSLKPLP